MLRVAALFLAILCCSVSVTHAAAKPLLREDVVAVFPDASFQLAHTGKAAFTGSIAPDIDKANQWLSAHLLQQEISFTTMGTDRYGRALITSEVQEKMLREGITLIYASAGDIPASWRVAEAQARTAKRGVWASESLMLTPDAAVKSTHGFHIIEGAITRIYEGKSATYLNFGEDWHSDFSITISAKQRRSMKAFLAGLKAGDRVRVRGSIIQENGPMIRLNHPDNLEVIR